MRAFAEAYPDLTIVQQAAAQIPWFHNCTILDKIKDQKERHWYIAQTVQNGWSRDVLVHQIESGLCSRQGMAITNFGTTLPQPESDLVQQLLKDPYYFEFLTLASEAFENDLERSLLEKLKDFLLELGSGFAFLGSQYHLEVGGRDFYLDLLFYHVKARCYFIVDLKVTEFEPEYVGKMGFYLAAADDLLRHPDDRPSVGLILCKSKNGVVAEYAVRNSQAPMGISEYKLAEPLPEQIQLNLPTIEVLERELKPFILDQRK
jgi:predicted nuclease of restriction endonuclease-like (RecB) superfamily